MLAERVDSFLITYRIHGIKRTWIINKTITLVELNNSELNPVEVLRKKSHDMIDEAINNLTQDIIQFKKQKGTKQ